MQPLVSVVIVNHNGIQFVDTCLSSVIKNDYSNFEVIFVDNDSRDGSLEYVKKKFGADSRIKIIENKASLGPAVGRNRGIAVAYGKYIAFLDNDTEVDGSWISELVKVFESDSTIGAAQSKLLRNEARDSYDYAGDYLNSFGFLSERSRGEKDTGQFDYICDIFSAKSAASIIRKDVLDVIGGFDEDYYMYLEETDLSWRVWLAGFRVVFIPKSVVYHAYGSKKKAGVGYYPPYVVRYYGCRNYISTLIKNLGFSNIIRILPLHLLSWVGVAMMFMLKLRFHDVKWILKAICWNFANIIPLLKKRNYIQLNLKKVRDRQLMSKIMIHNTLQYYFGKATSYIYGRPY